MRRGETREAIVRSGPAGRSSSGPELSEARGSARDTRTLATRVSAVGYRGPMGDDLSAETTWSGLGEGEPRWFLGTLATIRIPGEAVSGRFALIEFLFPQYASPPRHTHPQDESYIVLDGALTIEAGGRRFTLNDGGVAVVPMGIAHTFRVDSKTARVLVLSTPSGLERMILDGSIPASAPTLPPADAPRPTAAELSRIFELHGQVTCGPPLARDEQ
jgi:quercetin dioxygenase-like cupin family protein